MKDIDECKADFENQKGDDRSQSDRRNQSTSEYSHFTKNNQKRIAQTKKHGRVTIPKPFLIGALNIVSGGARNIKPGQKRHGRKCYSPINCHLHCFP
ncbi:hypothetical protein AVEN_259175-1 [Araneus ventricosus]|uniref:Uncharacterized protein n=1 Tax=Araneus ventricosus TaxID=182803 RepID=A0A4Y2KW31_ARAVE|nr:hypothetical protein AVEN_259175-1 [Araneus ventricosus]